VHKSLGSSNSLSSLFFFFLCLIPSLASPFFSPRAVLPSFLPPSAALGRHGSKRLRRRAGPAQTRSRRIGARGPQQEQALGGKNPGGAGAGAGGARQAARASVARAGAAASSAARLGSGGRCQRMRSCATARSAAGGGSQRRRVRATPGSGGARAARPAQERRLRARAQDGTACAGGSMSRCGRWAHAREEQSARRQRRAACSASELGQARELNWRGRGGAACERQRHRRAWELAARRFGRSRHAARAQVELRARRGFGVQDWRARVKLWRGARGQQRPELPFPEQTVAEQSRARAAAAHARCGPRNARGSGVREWS
jgi:hypothetical protein